MKKAVLFCPSRVWGGIEKNVHLRARFLGESGVQVYVILLQGYFADRFVGLENVTVIEVKSRGGDFNFFVVANYVKKLREIRPDVVFAALKKDWWLVTLASSLAGVDRIVLYLGISRRVKSPIKYFAIFRLMKAVLMVNSDTLKNEMLKYPRFFDDSNVFKVYNGFDLPPPEEKPMNFRELLNLPSNSVIVGCAGRFSPQKGFDLLPDILSRLPDNVHIVHAGEGEFEAEIKASINERPEAARIHFLGYQKNMHAFFKGIDLFLLCSRNEGMANVLNEAMSHGKPVVSTRVPGSEELLAHGKYGVLVDVNDVEALARGVKAIVDGDNVYSPAELRDWIDNEFGLHRMIRDTNRLFFESEPC
ncbi:glycosyl transferase family protein [Marinobacter lipolyticus SM19]|uniref:Glycosyl transferase family protein n=1 Tax=Marinobacter lipolyticus SM19 TaxID=1318628 RepID=R8AWF7_9GAMM|nr:glycosyltransferase [Marinobacter lipolyticus]EON90642.1 glycosyl transferase family protein [Marinobacter lipolyticus SM19]